MVKTYRTNWSLAHKSTMDKDILEMVSMAINNSHYSASNSEFFQYTLFIWLTGKRSIEPLLRKPTIELFIDSNEKQWYHVTSMVAKHFSTQAMRCISCELTMARTKEAKQHRKETGHSLIHIGERRISSHYWPIMSAEERIMWQFLMDGRQTRTLDFSRLVPKRFRGLKLTDLPNLKSLASQVARRFSNTYKMSITDGSTEVIGSLTPHMLRHSRAYDLLVNHKKPALWCQRMMDWDNNAMLYYYTDLKNSLHAQEEMLLLRGLPEDY